MSTASATRTPLPDSKIVNREWLHRHQLRQCDHGWTV